MHIVLLIIIFIVCISIYLVWTSFIFVGKIDCNDKMGIIDGGLSNTYPNIICQENSFSKKTEQKTHGDCLIDFTFNCNPNAIVYYYNAENNEGKITNERIISGLDWMVENSVGKVNLSLSNKKEYPELKQWIENHKHIIKVYASYNNLHNSNDYPAMFENVYGSGMDRNIGYKSIDIQYRSNRILVFHSLSDFKVYQGNSFLSIITMMKN